MPIFLILVLIVFLTILVGILVSVGVSRLDGVIKDNQAALAGMGSAFNVNLTLGHEITVAADFESQLKEARQLAAKNAARLPRGANMGIGRLGKSALRTTSENLANDPMSAVRIARHHGWEGARTGITAAGQPAAAAPAAAAAGGTVELVAGKDYPVIEITDDMPDADKRKARIANAKAKSAALKAAKAAGAAAAAPAAAAAATVPQPELVEITDDMSPDEKRKATIANAKAQSAYKKALKAAGEAAPAAAAAPAAPVAAAAPSVPEPELIEITDSMSPDEVRKARISNAKAKSAYNKALKAAGASAPAAAAEAPAAPAAPAPAAAPEPAANMPAPLELVEITDDMAPDEVRKARISNAKAKSAYNKALKAAGIDPKSV